MCHNILDRITLCTCFQQISLSNEKLTITSILCNFLWNRHTLIALNIMTIILQEPVNKFNQTLPMRTLALSYVRYILMSSRYVMDFAIEYIIMYVSTLFLNNFTLNILFVNRLYLNGNYVIVLKISAHDNQGHEDSK